MRTQLVVCSHGKLAEGVLSAAEMIMGPIEGILMYELMPGMSPDEWRAGVAADFRSLAAKEETRFIVLADLFGGSPCNTLVPLMHEFDMSIVTGLNLGMFLEVYSSMYDEEADLPEVAAETLRSSCYVLRPSDFS